MDSRLELSKNQELYADFGDGFHSNDARGVFQTLDPQTHETFDATGAPVLQVTSLVRAGGKRSAIAIPTRDTPERSRSGSSI